MLRVVTIVTICSTLLHFANFNIFGGLYKYQFNICDGAFIAKKDCKSLKNLCTKNFTFTKKFYVHEIAAVNLSKIYFLKNVKKTCKPNNRDLNGDWMNRDPIVFPCSAVWVINWFMIL